MGRSFEPEDDLETEELIGRMFTGTIIHSQKDKSKPKRALVNDENLEPACRYEEGNPSLTPEPKHPEKPEAPDTDNVVLARSAQVAGILKARGIPFALDYLGLEKKTEIMGYLRGRTGDELRAMVEELEDPFAELDK